MLLIDNKKLNVDLYDVLKKIHFINPAYLRIVKRAGSNVMCTCPFHGNHNEQHASCGVNNDRNSNARISAIDDKIIFNTGNAIRFGETAWDWNQWAGLKYTHSNKTIYLGIADNSIFNANSA